MTTEAKEIRALMYPPATPSPKELVVAARALMYCRWAEVPVPNVQFKWFAGSGDGTRRGGVTNRRQVPQIVHLRVGLQPVELFAVAVHELRHAADVHDHFSPRRSHAELEERAHREEAKALQWWKGQGWV